MSIENAKFSTSFNTQISLKNFVGRTSNIITIAE